MTALDDVLRRVAEACAETPDRSDHRKENKTREALTLLPQLAEMVRVAREGLEMIVKYHASQALPLVAARTLTAMEKAAEGLE